MLVFKDLIDCLFLLMLVVMVIILLQKILIKNIFFRDLKLKVATSIDGRNFYVQSIKDSINQYDEVRKILTGQSDDYTIGCLLDFAYLKRITD